jgi:hypothetical protein
MIYFISGHLSLTREEFETHYQAAIEKALDNGATFVVGDARGADALAQQFIMDIAGPRTAINSVVVYHMLEEPRNHIHGLPTKGGYTSDEARDAGMTAASDADIAWVRPGREKSGTQKNLDRRQQEIHTIEMSFRVTHLGLFHDALKQLNADLVGLNSVGENIEVIVTHLDVLARLRNKKSIGWEEVGLERVSR